MNHTTKEGSRWRSGKFCIVCTNFPTAGLIHHFFLGMSPYTHQFVKLQIYKYCNTFISGPLAQSPLCYLIWQCIVNNIFEMITLRYTLRFSRQCIINIHNSLNLMQHSRSLKHVFMTKKPKSKG